MGGGVVSTPIVQGMDSYPVNKCICLLFETELRLYIGVTLKCTIQKMSTLIRNECLLPYCGFSLLVQKKSNCFLQRHYAIEPKHIFCNYAMQYIYQFDNHKTNKLSSIHFLTLCFFYFAKICYFSIYLSISLTNSESSSSAIL